MSHSWILTPRQRCDLELLLVDGFAPLTGFVSESDYENILSHKRLTNHQLWPIPITLDVSDAFADQIAVGSNINLLDADNSLLATMLVTDKWQPKKQIEAKKVFGTTDTKHPAVNYLMHQAGNWYLGGPVTRVKLPLHYDFTELRLTPAALKQYFELVGWKNIVGFQTRNPIHRAHMELTLRAANKIAGQILLHPVVGLTKPGDVDYFTRVCCYQKVLSYYPEAMALLSLLPLAMRMAGPREALWHALIRKNYGCTHFIVGRDHAGPGTNSDGKLFYDPYAAQQETLRHQDELGITILPFQEMVYVKERKTYTAIDELKQNETALSISGTELRQALLTESAIPDWFSFPDVIAELRRSYPPKHQHGYTLFFTGLSGAGKSTLAQALMAELMRLGKRNVTLLDGDVVRRTLATELGFSQDDRNTNIRRIGFVAAEITKVGGIALCAAIAPYESSRHEIRNLISAHGGYIEIYISTSYAECEKRDTKGLYAKAKSGELKGFTGFDDPYELPEQPEITIDTANISIKEAVKKIILYLTESGYLKQSDIVPTKKAITT